jgi:prepilin-type N-terminal cleavage/methylation domain-containing protein
MKTRKKCEGFTIVELMTSMLALAILALAVSSMLIYGYVGWRRNTESVKMHRDAAVAMDAIAREIRNSSIDEISATVSEIQFASGVVRADPKTYTLGEIAYGSEVNIGGFSLNRNVVSNTVTVAFTLSTSDNADRNQYTMTIHPRN